jgi:hypothetical protein
MTKRIVAKVGEYEKDGQTKGEYQEVGVILENENGEFLLLDPGVSIAGLMLKQNALAAKTGKQSREMVMASIFDNNQQTAQQGNPQPQYPQQGYAQSQYAPPQSGYLDQYGNPIPPQDMPRR